MPPAYENNPKATGHGGMDYAMMDHVLQAILKGEPAPIDVRAGLAMTLPGISERLDAFTKIIRRTLIL